MEAAVTVTKTEIPEVPAPNFSHCIEYFLALIRERRAIYDHTIKAHHDRDLVESLWAEIAKLINVNVEDCKNKWSNLRNSYRRELRQRFKSEQLGSKKHKKWYLADHMAFMENLTSIQIASPAQKWFKTDSSDYHHLDFLSSYPEITLKEENTIYDPVSQTHKVLEAKLNQTGYSIINRKRPADDGRPDSLFFHSLLPDFMNLSKQRRRDFKLKAMTLLNEYLDEQETEEREMQMHSLGVVSEVEKRYMNFRQETIQLDGEHSSHSDVRLDQVESHSSQGCTDQAPLVENGEIEIDQAESHSSQGCTDQASPVENGETELDQVESHSSQGCTDQASLVENGEISSNDDQQANEVEDQSNQNEEQTSDGEQNIAGANITFEEYYSSFPNNDDPMQNEDVIRIKSEPIDYDE